MSGLPDAAPGLRAALRAIHPELETSAGGEAPRSVRECGFDVVEEDLPAFQRCGDLAARTQTIRRGEKLVEAGARVGL